jgi:hypothetical protein
MFQNIALRSFSSSALSLFIYVLQANDGLPFWYAEALASLQQVSSKVYPNYGFMQQVCYFTILFLVVSLIGDINWVIKLLCFGFVCVRYNVRHFHGLCSQGQASSCLFLNSVISLMQGIVFGLVLQLQLFEEMGYIVDRRNRSFKKFHLENLGKHVVTFL